MQEHMKMKKLEIVKYMEEKGITIQEYKVFLKNYKELDFRLTFIASGFAVSHRFETSSAC